MFYQQHIFFCTNQRPDGSGCGAITGDIGFDIAKQQLQAAGQWGEGKIRASKAGCLGRCANGPVCVVYPAAVWYSYFDEDDVREIVASHLIGGKEVERLKI